MDTTGAFGRSKINPWLRVCILTASVLGLAQCNNQSPSVKNSSPTAPPVDKQVPHKYCYFFVAALYNNYQFLVSPDTFFLYHNEVLEKTWFDKHYKKVEERNYYVKKSLNEVRSANTKLFIELKNGIPKMKYDQISKDVKGKIKKLGLHVDEKKVLNSGDLYFFLSKGDTAYYPSILVFNARNEKIDTIQWEENITEGKIEGFVLLDFKNDGFVDLIVFSKDTIHEGAFVVGAITSSPDWICHDLYRRD